MRDGSDVWHGTDIKSNDWIFFYFSLISSLRNRRNCATDSIEAEHCTSLQLPAPVSTRTWRGERLRRRASRRGRGGSRGRRGSNGRRSHLWSRRAEKQKIIGAGLSELLKIIQHFFGRIKKKWEELLVCCGVDSPASGAASDSDSRRCFIIWMWWQISCILIHGICMHILNMVAQKIYSWGNHLLVKYPVSVVFPLHSGL